MAIEIFSSAEFMETNRGPMAIIKKKSISQNTCKSFDITWELQLLVAAKGWILIQFLDNIIQEMNNNISKLLIISGVNQKQQGACLARKE